MLLLRCVVLLASVLLANATNCPVGQPGIMGEAGAPGLPGEKGDEGYDGLPGHRGMMGIPGYQGYKGEPGTEEDLYLEGAGEMGPAGPPGRNVTPRPLRRKRDKEGGYLPQPKGGVLVGSRGMPGVPGYPGFPGEKGQQGRAGLPGYPGLPGIFGERGPQGEPKTEYTIVKGPKGPKGQKGTCVRREKRVASFLVKHFINECSTFHHKGQK